jgi:hypothetical protein
VAVRVIDVQPDRPKASRILGAAVSGALHAALAAAILAPVAPRPRLAPAHTAPERNVEVFVVPQPEIGAAPGLKAFSAGQDAFEFVREGSSSAVPLPGFTFDFTKVADRATILFPFLSPGLSLDAFGLMPRQDPRRLYNPLTSGTDKPRGPRPALALTASRLQAIVDGSWSRRDRWVVFDEVLSLAAAHHPEEGALPTLFQRYVQQNSLQPYADTTMRDPRLWAQLGLAADHAAFIGFISRFASAHPSTKATTELLFLLDKLAQASFDCLVTLLDMAPIEDLRWTARQNREAYRLIEHLLAYYNAQLEERHISSPAALRLYYDKVRLAILLALLETTPGGYRAADARYLIGSIYWRHGDRQAALDVWRRIVADRADSYVLAYSDVLDAIHAIGDTDDAALRRRIDRALDAERGRWRDFSYTRLRQFGYRFDTY